MLIHLICLIFAKLSTSSHGHHQQMLSRHVRLLQKKIHIHKKQLVSQRFFIVLVQILFPKSQEYFSKYKIYIRFFLQLSTTPYFELSQLSCESLVRKS